MAYDVNRVNTSVSKRAFDLLQPRLNHLAATRIEDDGSHWTPSWEQLRVAVDGIEAVLSELED